MRMTYWIYDDVRFDCISVYTRCIIFKGHTFYTTLAWTKYTLVIHTIVKTNPAYVTFMIYVTYRIYRMIYIIYPTSMFYIDLKYSCE